MMGVGCVACEGTRVGGGCRRACTGGRGGAGQGELMEGFGGWSFEEEGYGGVGRAGCGLGF